MWKFVGGRVNFSLVKGNKDKDLEDFFGGNNYWESFYEYFIFGCLVFLNN